MNVKYMIGLKCQKKKKPFKSGEKFNTIKDVVINTNTGNPAFTFLEDDSCVDTHVCILMEDDLKSEVGKTDIQKHKNIHKKREKIVQKATVKN